MQRRAGRPPLTAPGRTAVVVEVDVPVAADDVLRWFFDPGRWTRFLGRHAWIDPREQGRIRIEVADGVFVAGAFVELGEHHLAFTWGREGDRAMPVGSTLVTIDVHPTGPATSRIELRHDGLVGRELIEEHDGGWRYHLTRLGVAASGVDRDTERVDLFLAATAEPHPIARRGLLERTCAEDVVVADGQGETHGIPQLSSKLGRLRAETPGARLVRLGAVQRAGTLLRCDYAVRRPADLELDRGELVASLDRQGRLGALSLFGSAAP